MQQILLWKNLLKYIFFKYRHSQYYLYSSFLIFIFTLIMYVLMDLLYLLLKKLLYAWSFSVKESAKMLPFKYYDFGEFAFMKGWRFTSNTFLPFFNLMYRILLMMWKIVDMNLGETKFYTRICTFIYICVCVSVCVCNHFCKKISRMTVLCKKYNSDWKTWTHMLALVQSL